MNDLVGQSHDKSIIDETLNWFAKSATSIILLLDSEGKIKYMNPAFEIVLQYELSEVLGINLSEFIHKEDCIRLKQGFFAPNFTPFTIKILGRNGNYETVHWNQRDRTEAGWIRVIGYQIVDYDGNRHDIVKHPPGLDFFELSGEAAVICDLEGRIVILNAAHEQLYGWSLSEIKGEIMPTIPEQLYYEFQENMAEILGGEKVIHRQTMRMKKDGTLFPVSLTLSPVFNEAGYVIGMSAITRDLTELLETKILIEMQNEVIAEREKMLLDITENISEVICLYDYLNCKILYISSSYEQMWGISVEEMYRNPKVAYKRVYSEDRKKIRKILKNPGRHTQEFEYKIKGLPGEEDKWIRTKVTPIMEEEGRIARLISVSEDITDWRNKEQMLKKQEKLGVLGQLAAGIAHEIRNPLTSIKGFTQLLAKDSNSAYHPIIRSELEHIESIVNEFLMLANPYQEMDFINKNINEVLNEVLMFMRPEALLNKIEIDTKFAKVLPFVYCIPKQIKQVIINLIKNAIEAMPSGGDIIITTFELADGYVCIEVIDRGIGIPEEMLERLGEPFYSNKERGTGLGLMVSFKIIENHGGTMHFASEVDNGTTVTIVLPAVIQ